MIKTPFLRLLLTSIMLCHAPIVLSQTAFEDWLTQFKEDAIANGIQCQTAEAAVQHIALLPEVIKLDHAQPEFINPFLDYYHQRVDLRKVLNGRAMLSQHAALLNQLEAQYGVQKAYLIAFWGMETNYGNDQGC